MSDHWLRLEGAITALVTPFKDGKVDTVGLMSLVECQIRHGISAIVACGTTGESATLSRAERRMVIERCVEVAEKNVPVIAGTGTNCTETTVELTTEAKTLGSDAALIVAPYYNKPSQEGIYRHYEAVVRAVDLPVIVYNVPSRSGVDIAPRTLERLAQLPGVVGIKDATGDVGRFLASSPSIKAQLCHFSGNDQTALPFNLCGGHGTISVAANVVPRLMVSLHHAITTGNAQAAVAIHQRLQPLFIALERETNPGPIKYALHLARGLSPDVRLPLTTVSPETAAEIRSALEPLAEVRSASHASPSLPLALAS
ncbi:MULTISPECIES: 4-hydroxy-tetrahydrodipicolinate synthase [Ensifer]|jgi:4-hydroxy-tetrahydrodipicolinate synthase|uniref:4-hydroxy-tetrahydrodipicolinate synthase n=1 Tax=Ensifer canadensis TaxID=555315 RepID=A0AAW4FMU3_9HYPH|nr:MULTISPECIES: 4-hydroxy-tetrahydrodipicolinate synthase [Ensifer]AHK42412.1 dihydrodipicolinate synthase [Ensifer adhaerens OV14]KQU95360.1 4-hydroxy-tetrahydrodipicolinate synthase [Ensifer sp. Root31]KQW39784.1 4-hydroxy-tetrahydrodipicolinate synthase [Ensifer sp. Root1252]KQY61004.1 4-hydroxy-tetrahydrodipicolinate synthase [Ensifer sp. Root142]KRC60114.1 4-hydroxy-tetrahydrodipicolinate synthase [Ensifer sp. Root231]